MKLALVGVGQAGGKIVDRFLEYDQHAGPGFITSATVINTAKTDLAGLDNVPEQRRVLIGTTRTKGHGVGADNELGAKIALEESADILGAVGDVPLGRTDAFLVIAALGGGTGSGGASVIARRLREAFGEPVYGIGILPARDEGGLYMLNAARSLKTFVNEVDNLLLFDNDTWRKPGESLAYAYREINDEIARRFGVLFSAGEIDPGESVAENVVDSSEIINTLACGGVSSVGYASERLDRRADGLLARFRSDGRQAEEDPTSRITSLVRKATLGRLTLPCEIESTNRVLIVVSGPSRYLSRKGVERAREWLEEEAVTMEVRGGDYPIDRERSVAVAVLLAGVTDAPRLQALQDVAVETQNAVKERADRSEEEFRDLLMNRDELDPLL